MFNYKILNKEINWFSLFIFSVFMLPLSFVLLFMSRHIITIIDGILLTPPI